MLRRLTIAVSLLFLASSAKLAAQIEVPVVVHIVSTDPDKTTDKMVEDGIKDLNEAFSHQGKYASLGPGYNTGIRFCLAKRDPNGGNTKGITRTKSVLGDFDRDIEDLRMKGLVSWDTKRYCNIWLVDTLKTEIFPTFLCGKWKRSTEQGYATYPSTGEYWDGVVVNTFGEVLAHNMGHYLGLVHTFFLNECANNDCNLDGDGICDTPPSKEGFLQCGTSVNSCSTDTLNGQGPDLPDLVGNFMTYNECTWSFTKGQSDRMKVTLSGDRSGLLWPDRCAPACAAENVLASFTRDDWFPVKGGAVAFTNTGSRGTRLEWYVDGTLVSTGDRMSHTFADTGKYAVTLKAFNGDPSCFGSQTDSIIVTCGVMARYFPDKRFVASRDPILLDEVIFTNRSVPLDASFEWWLDNKGSFPLQRVSTDRDLRYTFMDSGTYVIRLVASVGGCTDTTLPYKLRVEDPSVDVNISLGKVECVDDTSLRIGFQVCNDGYSSMPAGVPVTFYDDDPTSGPAKRLGQFIMPDDLKGKCCIQLSHEIDVGRRGLDKVFAVINDDASLPTPFRLLEPPPFIPNANARIPEKLYANNLGRASGFAFRVTATPPTANLIPGQLLQLAGGVSLNYQSASWLPSPGLSCADCLSPSYKVGFEDERLYFRAKSQGNCHDTAVVDVTVPPWNDFGVTIDSVECHSAGNVLVSFTVCNDFVNGYIPAGLVVSFYAQDPSQPGSQVSLGTAFKTVSNLSSKCASFSHVVPAGLSGTIYAVVNDIGTMPFSVPGEKEYQERDYSNNVGFFEYTRPPIIFTPSDTVVMRRQTVPVSVNPGWILPSTVVWVPDPTLQLSCSVGCPNTSVTVLGDGLLRLQVENRLGCRQDTVIRFRILPPDLRIRIDSVECYSDREVRVDFTVCTDNGYDELPAGLPVAFYDGSPGSGTPVLLPSSFQTQSAVPSRCASYRHMVGTPKSGRMYAVVNQRQTVVIPSFSIQETDFGNNTDARAIEPFRVSILPADTSVPRLSRLELRSTHTGGVVSSYSWQSAASLSCTDCPNPIATIPYTSTFTLQVRNRFECLASDTMEVKTFAEGRYRIPNAFTPNGDGLNDVFYLIGNRDVETVREFIVFDRYGQRVFQRSNGRPNDPSFGWNGTRNGTPVANGTYIYTFQVVLADGTSDFLKGQITVIR